MDITIFLIIITTGISLLAFSNHQFIDNLIFYPFRIWRDNEWHRLFSCSFIHADMMHLFFNMFALYSFGSYIEKVFQNIFEGKGHTMFLLMYFGAVATADVWNLFKQKHNPNYRSLGASGGVAAIIFSYILLSPHGGIGIPFISGQNGPWLPAYIFGPLYLVYCVYMAKRGGDNIGHIAHFTGSVFGFIFPILFEPRLLGRFFSELINGM